MRDVEHGGWSVIEVGDEPRLERDADGRWHIFAPGWTFEHSATYGDIHFEDGALLSFDSDASAAHLEFGGILICGHRLDELRDLAQQR